MSWLKHSSEITMSALGRRRALMEGSSCCFGEVSSWLLEFPETIRCVYRSVYILGGARLSTNASGCVKIFFKPRAGVLPLANSILRILPFRAFPTSLAAQDPKAAQQRRTPERFA